jgi:phosphoenolpyruvate carboxylase
MPWSFSWGQCRLTLPGWFGFGSAVEQFLGSRHAARKQGSVALLQRMYRSGRSFARCCRTWTWCWPRATWRWPRAMPSWWGRALRKKVFSMIEAEWHRTADALTLITGEKQRLAGNAALQRSIRHRFPYIDPLHHLQVELMRRYRAGRRRAAAARHPHFDQRHRGGLAQYRLTIRACSRYFRGREGLPARANQGA